MEITEILVQSYIFYKYFVKASILLKSWFHEIFFRWSVISSDQFFAWKWIGTHQCRKTRNSLTNEKIRQINSSNFFSKNSIFTKFLQKKVWEKIVAIAQCGNYGNSLSRIFGKKFRESNGFTKVTIGLIWRNIFLVRDIFSIFHTVNCSGETDEWWNDMNDKKIDGKLQTFSRNFSTFIQHDSQ